MTSLKESNPKSIVPFTLTALIFSLYIIFCHYFINWSPDIIKKVIIIHYFLAWIIFLIARKVTVYDHRFFIHPTSYIGQTSVDQRSNMKGFWGYLLFSYIMANMTILIGVLMFRYFGDYKHTELFGAFLYFTAFFIFAQGVIPINLSEWLHIFVTALVFAGMTAVNISLLIFYQKLQTIFHFPPILPILSWLLMVASLVYLLAYIVKIRPGFFQKLWILMISLVLFANGIFFCNSI